MWHLKLTYLIHFKVKKIKRSILCTVVNSGKNSAEEKWLWPKTMTNMMWSTLFLRCHLHIRARFTNILFNRYELRSLVCLFFLKEQSNWTSSNKAWWTHHSTEVCKATRNEIRNKDGMLSDAPNVFIVVLVIKHLERLRLDKRTLQFSLLTTFRSHLRVRGIGWACCVCSCCQTGSRPTLKV